MRACLSLSDKWEILLNNLGHTLRKLGRYQESISFHQQALLLSPLNPSTYSTLDYVQTLTGDLTIAKVVIEQMMNCVAPFPGLPDTPPQFPSLVISPKSPSSSRECSPIMEEDSMSILDTSFCF